MADVVDRVIVTGSTQGLDQVVAGLQAIDQLQSATAQSALALAKASDSATQAQISAARNFDRLRASVDPAFQATQRMAKGQVDLERALSLGVVSASQYATVQAQLSAKLAGTTTAHNDNAKAAGLSSLQMSVLGGAARHAFDAMASGAGVVRAVSMEAGHLSAAIGEDGVAGMFSALAVSAENALESVTGMAAAIPAGVVALGALGAVVVGAGAAYARLASNQRDVAVGIAGAGRASGATVGGINRVADQNSDLLGGMSAQSVREMSTEFAKTGHIGATMYGDLSRFAKDYAVLSGTDVVTASKTVAAAFADESAGARKLNDVIGGLDGQTARLIERLQAEGNHLGAQRAMLDAFSEAAKAAAGNVSIFTRAWDAAKAGASNTLDFVGRQVAMAIEGGTDLEERLATAQKILEASKTREQYVPFGLGTYDTTVAQANVDALTSAIAKQKALIDQAQVAQKSLAAEGVLKKLFPTATDITSLTTAKTALQEALDAGKAPPGTVDGLARITRTLEAGGTALEKFTRASRDAFDQSALLPYDRGLAQIAARYRDLIRDDPEHAGMHRANQRRDVAAYNVEQVNVPLREQAFRGNEQASSLRLQRDNFYGSTEQIATASAKQDLLNDAIRRNIPITDDYTKKLDVLASQAGKVAVAEEDLQRKRATIVGGMDELRSGTSGMITGIASDLRQRKNPLDNIMSNVGRMTDQYFDRMVSKPISDALLGFVGKPGGGLFGDATSKMFGSVSGVNIPAPVSTASMMVTAASVSVNGGALSGATPYPVGKVDTAPLGAPAPLSNMPMIPGSTSILDGSKFTSPTAAISGNSKAAVEAYVRQAAAVRGINPDIAARVVKEESSFNYDAKNLTMPDQSYGPMQLNLNGGLGVPASKLFDVTNPDNWRQNVDFGMNTVAKDGWRQWMGAKNSGVGRWDGIGQHGADLSVPADQATKSLSSLSDQAGGAAKGLGSLGDGFDQFGAKLSQASLGGGGSGGGGFGGLGGLFGGSGGSGGSPFTDDSGTMWFADGGYTGAGGKYQPAGIVHAGEFVFSQGAVSRIGLSALNTLHRGYAEGGYVSPAPVAIPTMPSPAANANVAPVIHAPLTIHQTIAANGDRAIADIARQQAVAAVGQHQRHLERTLPGMLDEARGRRAA